MDLIELLDPKPGERILDVGCGIGLLTRKLVDKGAIVTGLDKSAPVLEQARLACPGASFVHSDLLGFSAETPFDAVFSNGVLQWIQPPGQAAERIFAALRPGGRFVAEFGGHGNLFELLRAAREIVDIVEPLVPLSWYGPNPGEYASVLESAGFEVLLCLLFDRPTELEGGGAGLRSWLEMFGGPLPASSEPGSAAELADALRGDLCRDGVWWKDCRRLRVAARRPLT